VARPDSGACFTPRRVSRAGGAPPTLFSRALFPGRCRTRSMFGATVFTKYGICPFKPKLSARLADGQENDNTLLWPSHQEPVGARDLLPRSMSLRCHQRGTRASRAARKGHV
jgi:hypothetical protein